MSAEKILQGDVRATAQLIRRIDDGDRQVLEDLAELYRHSGRAHVIGFTGSPGVGKSSLVDRIVAKFRQNGKTVGVLAVDPTSPFTGGAILGDRIRMQKHFLDEGVFIRSLATRGKFGGLTRSTTDAIVVLDAMGKDVIIVETVGVGQDEVDIVHSAHTTVLVTVPGMGDDIQAIKAGLMEIGDLFVVNKADREGASKTLRELRSMLQMSGERRSTLGWEPPVIATVALENDGVDELYEAILEHRRHLLDLGGEVLKKVEASRIRMQLLDLLKDGLFDRAYEIVGGAEGFDAMVEDILARHRDPYGVSVELVDRLLGGQSP
ncbi:MAG: methylmalonyl Co-A mutase-associated GTPase MeaB [Desulfomonilaceae bacterium]|nr:methylmalonyl Co-A mutase-associated GTPase MeaB [Desulfomonilaceae bacterium]